MTSLIGVCAAQWGTCAFFETLALGLQKMRLIINADDFGKDENATTAIVKAFREGYVNQTTLMVNMPWADRAVEMAKGLGFADKVGLHLNITEGVPLTENMSACRVFCDEGGVFKCHIPTADELKDATVCSALTGEIKAQVQKYQEYDLSLMHCDGHHHVQTRLHIARVLMPILRKYGFKSIRRPNNCYDNSYAFHLRSRLHQLAFTSLARKYDLQLTTWFTGWKDLNFNRMRGHVLEIMVHPRYDDRHKLLDVQDFHNNTGRPMCDMISYVGERFA